MNQYEARSITPRRDADRELQRRRINARRLRRAIHGPRRAARRATAPPSRRPGPSRPG
ncbi:hypothetical protein [Salinactinospora qingdaonensis]|uniref:Uncharacterized protein n=1 Tax=Salinactinospora qingdaonensis TaxID=702744 RepID=A0ABP7GHA5_9ACTN